MGLLTMDYWWTRTNPVSAALLPCRNSTFIGGKFIELYEAQKILPAKPCRSYRVNTRAFASWKSVKKLKGDRQPLKTVADSPPTNVQEDNMVHSFENSAAQNFSIIPSRGAVLQACTITSGFIAALGIIIRQVSHVASVEGLPILDCAAEVSFGFEIWHLELITGLVVLISSCRYLLLKTWPDFAVSSEAANRQVLSSLQLLDYIIVAFLPGISEELLFRGALLPLFGLDWKSVSLVAAVFGVLHLGNGRKYSFAVWACFVGLVYGYATILSSSIIVPMASHAANNLVGGILWRYTSNSSQKS
ncbi:hypothetical protein CJ030_MR0G004681 [Morella rubra]|uniref:CAAX prenyl protease 2/Lysostaphin resistance protein A-like domain-containing protein n=1 Tax=Morella rubra TaxID=262757 RepID=A0A6A1UQ36_9ROSI|nr:hypothetical protein CJ030_MR0G004681 [Morella rubra]